MYIYIWKAFVRADLLETVVVAMDRLVEDWNVQACGCDAISFVVAALPEDGELLEERTLEAGVHLAAARAVRRLAITVCALVCGIGICACVFVFFF